MSVDQNRESRNRTTLLCPSNVFFIKVQKQFNAESTAYHTWGRNNWLFKHKNELWPKPDTSWAHPVWINLNLNSKSIKLF